MKFTSLSATVAVVALLCGAVAAHAQTMSGKGIDTSTASGYGAQLQLDEVKAQQVVNTTAISTQGEQLDDVTGRLDGIDGRLDQISEQISDLSKSMKTIQKTLTQVTSKTETLESALSANATGEEEPQAELCPDRNVKVTFAGWVNSPTALALGTVANGLSTVAVKRKTGNACAGKVGSCKATFETVHLTFRCSPQNRKLVPIRLESANATCMFSGNKCRLSANGQLANPILVTVE